ncbi:MAG: tRNA (adenosine(37)-N6)-threonylcarbamoyltransferase complex ATPase subunit type 1 TsaE [Chloroflexi bacterium]|nr:tRNA (adenosine(37)-N6)-threonylcarbamoyltransferase complex ATPase subunit type 1 TsaE [Chloroflexota bacterium]
METAGPEATAAVGEALGRLAQPGDVVLLRGDLGAGKTCLTQGLGRGLGITQPVTSPTFVLAAEYREGRLPLFHLDLYRLAGDAEADDLGLDEYFEGGGVTVVEWPDRAPGALPAEHLMVDLAHVRGNEAVRRLTVTAAGERAAALALALAEALRG